MSQEIPSKLLVPRPLRFDEVNDSINKSGYLSQAVWGIDIKRNLQSIEDLTSHLFPYNGDKRLPLLFVALKVHFWIGKTIFNDNK